MDCFIKDTLKISHHGREIYGVFYKPEVEKECPIVIFSHGYNGTHVDFAMNSEYLASRGIASYCFDFCGGSVNSKSDLQTTEMTIFTEKEDLCAIIEYFKNRKEIDNNNIFLFGGSQGGLVTAMAAEEYLDDVKGMLLLFPAFCIPDNWNERFAKIEDIPETLELWGMTLGKVFFESMRGYDVFKHIGKFHKNVLIFHGDKDAVVALEYGSKASKMYPHSTIEVFEGEGHGFSEAGNRRVAEMTYDFVKENM
jgi:dipeptidyl aminopeptidase/acylaminoacyl peptidase